MIYTAVKTLIIAVASVLAVMALCFSAFVWGGYIASLGLNNVWKELPLVMAPAVILIFLLIWDHIHKTSKKGR